MFANHCPGGVRGRGGNTSIQGFLFSSKKNWNWASVWRFRARRRRPAAASSPPVVWDWVSDWRLQGRRRRP
eukprot:9442089-Pyramimonas_sp.AAC.1